MPKRSEFNATTTTEEVTKWTERMMNDAQRVQKLARSHYQATDSEEMKEVQALARGIFSDTVKMLDTLETL